MITTMLGCWASAEPEQARKAKRISPKILKVVFIRPFPVSAGMSMSRFILMELRKVVERPSREEVLERIGKLPPVELDPSPAEIIRAEREAR
ncbi:MAG: hypothetical protein ACE5JX_22770 [Acidobacteriota bacterium]